MSESKTPSYRQQVLDGLEEGEKVRYYGLIFVFIIFIIFIFGFIVKTILDKRSISENGIQVEGLIYKIRPIPDHTNMYFLRIMPPGFNDSLSATIMTTDLRGKVGEQVPISYVPETGHAEFLIDSGYFSLWILIPLLIFFVIVLLVGIRSPDWFTHG